MSDPSAVASPPPPREAGPSWHAEPTPSEGWSRNKFLFFIALAFALHVSLILVFGTKKQVVPLPPNGAATNVPHLQLVANTDRLIALGDPTLFARPNAHDAVTAFWRQMPPVGKSDSAWAETPAYLPPAPESLGSEFRQFMQSSQPGPFRLELKPEPKLTEPVSVPDEPMPHATQMQITGGLAGRRLLNPSEPPTLAMNSVIAPSRVRVLVDAAGNVKSAVPLPLDSAMEEASRSDQADATALAFVRSLRFEEAPRLTIGEIIFRWHTVPAASTNAP